MDKIYALADCYDDSVLTIMQTENDSGEIKSPDDEIIVTNQRGTVKLMRQLLEEMWKQARPLAENVKLGKEKSDFYALKNISDISAQKSESAYS